MDSSLESSLDASPASSWPPPGRRPGLLPTSPGLLLPTIYGCLLLNGVVGEDQESHIFLIQATTQREKETNTTSPTHRIIPRAHHVVVDWDLLPPQEEEEEEEEEEMEEEEDEEKPPPASSLESSWPP